MPLRLLSFLLLSALSCVALGQAPPARTELVTKPGTDTVRMMSPDKSISAANEIQISVHAQLLQAIPTDGKLTLNIVSELNSPSDPNGMPRQSPRLILQIPLAGSADAYGESRACFVSKEGQLTFVFTAGLDEQNFVKFTQGDDREFRFLLNKYFCRALAAPFQCGEPGQTKMEQKLSDSMAQWKVGADSYIELSTAGSPAKALVSGIEISSSGHKFDYATCEKIAPSNGMCCVGHKSTQWHCGGTPVGEGWHQVSGDCFHRETGASCNR